jgi:hypothetical protein
MLVKEVMSTQLETIVPTTRIRDQQNEEIRGRHASSAGDRQAD